MNRNYRGRIGTIVNKFDIVPALDYHKKNDKKMWEYREYPEYDINFICISKDGTLGEIWKVGDLFIGLPSSDGKEIINEGKSPEESKWKRETPPPEFRKLWNKYKREMASEKNAVRRTTIRENFIAERDKLMETYADFIKIEDDKREHGIFIKIDKEIHYLTGEYWMFLSHYYLTESAMYGYFRVVAMEALWHWEAVRADSRVWGEIRGKGRRTSWSVESASIALNAFTITKFAEIPIVSERKDLAEKLFKGKIVNSFGYYPIYFKPIIPLPNQNVSSNLEIQQETDEAETSVIDYYPTKSTAYDSTKVKNVSINDEIGKWENESLSDFIVRHMRCHTEGGATARFGSTAGAYSGGGGEEFEVEFKAGDATKRNDLGRTSNGLVSFFIDICYTMTQPRSYFDQWGYSIVHDPVEPIQNENGEWLEIGAITDWQTTHDTYKKEGKKKKLNAFLRDMPRTVEHMFRDEGGIHNDFDTTNLNNHDEFLSSIPEEEMDKIIHRGNLVWTGAEYDSDVRWMPNENGRIETTWIPPKDLQNKHSKRQFYGKTLKFPDNNHIGAFGIDSYDISQTVDKVGSNGAIVGMSKFNLTGCPQKSFFLKYLHRPDKETDFYDDAIKICHFFGMYALIENNKPKILDHFTKCGYRGYSMTRPDKKWRDLSQPEKDNGGVPASKEFNKDVASLLKDYIVDYIGQNLDKDCYCYFLDMIKEWKKFNVNKRQKFDLSVACQLALMATQYKVKQRKTVNIGNESSQGISLSDFSA